LVLLELVFWLMWDCTPAHASTVLAIFQAAYETEFGYQQENSTAMLDDEGLQLTRDIAAMWILITIEVLNLEEVVEHGFELSASTGSDVALHNSPTSMEAIHKLVMSHTSTGYLCTLLAWAFYLKGVTEAASRFPETPPEYANFLKNISFKTAAAYRKDEQELHATVIAACLRPDAGLFNVLHSLLTTSPHFVTAIAWKTGSAVTESNSVAYRAVIRGM
jgi:nuclear pore complex protein Nup188